MNAVLIIGHGSRSKKFQDDFEKVVDMVREKKKDVMVYGASMELSEPTIENTVERMIAENPRIKEIAVVPFFLFEGIHIREDIPEKIEGLEKKYPDVIFKFGKPIGADPMLAEILVKRVEEIL